MAEQNESGYRSESNSNSQLQGRALNPCLWRIRSLQPASLQTVAPRYPDAAEQLLPDQRAVLSMAKPAGFRSVAPTGAG